MANRGDVAIRHTVLRLLALIAISICVGGCIAHRSGFEGKVVDATTGKPIEGVVVLAHWRLGYYLLAAQDGGALQLYETVTDKDGRFQIPSWTKMYSPTRGTMTDNQDPELLIFKSGYRFKRVLNYPPDIEELMGGLLADEKQGRESIRESEWNGHGFKLMSISTKDDREESINDFAYVMLTLFAEREMETCMWKDVSRTLLALKNEVKEIGQSYRLDPIDHHRRQIVACGEGRTFGWE